MSQALDAIVTNNATVAALAACVPQSTQTHYLVSGTMMLALTTALVFIVLVVSQGSDPLLTRPERIRDAAKGAALWACLTGAALFAGYQSHTC